MSNELDRNAAVFPSGTVVGAAGELVRTTTWSGTSLGPVSTWPLSLVAHVRALLHTRQPTMLMWGTELAALYNDAFLPILGGRRDVPMGAPAATLWGEAWTVLGPLFERVRAGESIYREECLVPITRDGAVESAWWNQSFSALFDDRGDIAGVLVVCTDVTREILMRRRLEVAQREADGARRELQGIFMQAPLPMCLLTGKNHRFTLANRHYLALVGRDVLGRTLSEAFSAEEIGYYLPILDRVYETGEPVFVREAPLQIPNEEGAVEDRLLNIGYQPHRDSTGAVAGVMVVVNDVTLEATARRRLQTQAERQSLGRVHADAQRVQAEAANRAKDEFLATVSHELRTPLTAILGWSRMLLEDGVDVERRQRGLGVIERNAQAQAKIIDDILDVSRIISGKLRLGVRPIDVAQLIEDTVESVRPAAEAKGITLDVDVEGPLPLVADGDRLQQVVWNLLSNAVKFTPRGGAVKAHAAREDASVRIQVRDTGTGIAPAFLPHVFDRFRQHDASTTKQHAGLGLGLAIVRHLVELHGGTVSAHSPGEELGATFEVSLPVRDAAHETPAVSRVGPAGQATRTARSRDRLRGLCILVVDDQPDARELVAMVLEEAGAQLLQAGSARAAMDLLESAEVSVIVSDIGMPGEDGYAFLERVRATPRTEAVPALALTAYARSEERERALASGFQDHLAKPIDPATLVSRVAALLRR